MAEARRVEKTYIDTNTQIPANRNRPPLRVVENDVTRNTSIQTKSTNADRNVKKTYQAPREQQDIATQFQDSYSKQGLQPRGLVNEAGETSSRQPYQQPEQITRSQQTQQKQRGLVKRGVKTIGRRSKFKKRNVAKRALAKTRVTAVNIWVWGWGLWSWAIFQLPFAIFSILMMALHEAIFQAVDALVTKKESDGFFVNLGKDVLNRTFDTLGEAAVYLANLLFKIDITIFSPVTFFTVSYLIVLLFGWFTLMLIYFMYKGSFLRPISGKGSTLKICTLFLAVIGYAIPVLNLFPWFVFWTMAVWWYPK